MITKAYCHETFEKALPYVFKSRIERGGWRGGIARGGCRNSQKIVSGRGGSWNCRGSGIFKGFF